MLWFIKNRRKRKLEDEYEAILEDMDRVRFDAHVECARCITASLEGKDDGNDKMEEYREEMERLASRAREIRKEYQDLGK